MMPLKSQWGIKSCNVDGCKNDASTILTDVKEGVPALGVCERHYQEAKTSGKWNVRFTW